MELRYKSITAKCPDKKVNLHNVKDIYKRVDKTRSSVYQKPGSTRGKSKTVPTDKNIEKVELTNFFALRSVWNQQEHSNDC